MGKYWVSLHHHPLSGSSVTFMLRRNCSLPRKWIFTKELLNTVAKGAIYILMHKGRESGIGSFKTSNPRPGTHFLQQGHTLFNKGIGTPAKLDLIIVLLAMRLWGSTTSKLSHSIPGTHKPAVITQGKNNTTSKVRIIYHSLNNALKSKFLTLLEDMCNLLT